MGHDNCKHCTLRGDLPKCIATTCSQHDNWYSHQQDKRIEQLEEMLEISKKATEEFKEGATIALEQRDKWEALAAKAQQERDFLEGQLELSKQAAEEFKESAEIAIQQRDEWMAHCENLVEAVHCADITICGLGIPHAGERTLAQSGVDMIRELLAKTPAASLSLIQAKAIEGARDAAKCKVHIDRPHDIQLTEICYVDDLTSIAGAIREQAMELASKKAATDTTPRFTQRGKANA